MRSIAAKFLLPLALLGVLFAVFLHHRSYAMTHKHLLAMADQQAAIAMEFNLAVREYVAEQIRPIVAGMIGEDEFIPEAMSTSFVSRSVFEKVRRKFPETIIKFSSDNPRNPVNVATADELRMIDYFNKHQDVGTASAMITVDGKAYRAHFTPKRMEPSCLRCHGQPEDAPAALRARYGSEASFHRPLGQVVALDTVAIPLSGVDAAVVNETTKQTTITLVGLALLLGAIALLFRFVVSRRLHAMAAHFHTIASQADTKIGLVETSGRGEIGALAVSFNQLAARLQQTYQSLEERVAERTRALEETNSALVRQIANREQVEQQLRRAKAAAEAATQAKSAFLANMSHEVRTPMTAILGYTDLLLEHDAADEHERTNAARTIKRNGEYLLQILNDILDLSKIEAGLLRVERVPCDARRIVTEVVELIQGRAAAKGLALDVARLDELPETILTDPTRLRQILINVVGNAVKFTNGGGVRIEGRICQAGAEPMLQIDVADTGVGIGVEQWPRLFQPFIQADSSATRPFGGTGLGLAISKRLAEMLGGDLTIVDSRPGVGTCFRCTVATGSLAGGQASALPARQRDAGSAVAGETRATDPSVLQGYRILVAEDCEDNRRLVVRLLERAGASVTAVENGALAVTAARTAPGTRPFHAVLMDVQMPVTDGYEATRLLREGGYRGAIVALTAHAMTSDRDQCLRCGCDEYVTKPIQFTLLADAIRRAVACRLGGVEAGTAGDTGTRPALVP